MIYKTYEIKSQLINDKYNEPLEMLFFYIKDDNFPKFKEILEKYKINLENKDNEGNSLLNLAVQCKSFEITKFLIDIGSEVNTQNVFLCLKFRIF